MDNNRFLPRSPNRAPANNDIQSSDLADDIEYASAAAADDAPPRPAIAAVASRLSPDRRTDVLRNIARCLSVDELRCLRLAGSKALRLDLADPSLTRHLQLRMDRAPFFLAAEEDDDDARTTMPKDRIGKWLARRRRLVIDDVDAKICPNRVERLLAEGHLDSVTELAVFDCHVHRKTISALLARLPNLESLRLADDDDEGRDEGRRLEELESVVARVGEAAASPSSLKRLDVEFDRTVHGSRLSFLERLRGLEHLRLRGFDLSDGINYLKGLRSLTSLHLCHGNFYSSPSNDVDERDLSGLGGRLPNLRYVHLEGFDGLSGVGLAPFCAPSSPKVERLVLKHCQELGEGCLPSLGRMRRLDGLHLVHSAYDDTEVFGAEGLGHLNSLASLRSLSLFYVLGDLSDLRAMRGLDKLETLNVAMEEEVDEEGVEHFCDSILPVFASLRKLRIFSEDGASYACRRGKLQVEYSTFNFGDLVYLD